MTKLAAACNIDLEKQGRVSNRKPGCIEVAYYKVDILRILYIIYIIYIYHAMYSRDRYEIMGLREISHFIFVELFARKKRYKCIKVAETNSMLAKQSGKLNFLIYSKLLRFQASPKFRWPACHKTGFC